ncbi:MAG: carbohydrate-binding protein [Protaetiibacter sp.]
MPKRFLHKALAGVVIAATTGTLAVVAAGGAESAWANAPRVPLTYSGGDADWYNKAGPSVMMPKFIDWNGDGERDAIDGDLLFINSGDDEVPRFPAAGTPLSVPAAEGELVDWDGDGDHDYLSRYDLHLHENTGTDSSPTWVDRGELTTGGHPITTEFDGVYVRWNQNQSPSIVVADWDADGDSDLLIGIADRVVVGSTKTVYTHGVIVLFENTGTASVPVLAAGELLHTSTADLDVPYKPTLAVADWNGDSEADVLYGDYRGDVWFLERDGDDMLPAVRILDTGDVTAWLDVADRDGDGDLDLIVTSTRGMLLLENTGTVTAASLVERGYVKTSGAGLDIRVGLFQTPYAVDWEDDGDLDLVVGDENGRISVFENVGTRSAPQLVNAVAVEAAGAPINFDSSDADGSWEWGPSEAAAGYTNPVAVDWDDDGDLDLITQDAQKATLWYFENMGTRAAPTYAAAVEFQLDGDTFTNPWRCRVAAMDWDDDGDLDLVQAGDDNILTVYTRDGGDLDLTVLEVAEDAAGRPIAVPSSRAGRTNLQAVDWDDDGLTDLIQAGYGSTALIWLRNVGTVGAPVFETRYILNDGQTIYESISNHTPKTFAVDWDDDGDLDLIDVEVWGSIYLVDGSDLAHSVPTRNVGRLEAESLTVSSDSGDPLSVFTDGGASAGAVLRYEATAVGDFVALDPGEVPAGRYEVVAGMRVAPNRGTVQLSVDGAPVGSPIDGHATTAGYRQYSAGFVTVGSGGIGELRVSVTGKNAASASYAVYLDYVELRQRIEPEAATSLVTSGDAVSVYTDAAASAGGVLQYAANAVGDYVAVDDIPLTSGPYRVVVGMRVAPNRAIVQTSIDGAAAGSPIDAYSATAGYQRFDLGIRSFAAAGGHEIRFTVTGKNSASGTYAVYVDYVELLPVGTRVETDLAPLAGTSGEPLGIFVDPRASGGATANFAANGVGDHVTYHVDAPRSGSYQLIAGFRVAANRGTVQLSVDGVPVGSPIDTRRTTAGYLAFSVGTVSLAQGSHQVRIEVTGKHGSSTTYAVYPDYLDLVGG